MTTTDPPAVSLLGVRLVGWNEAQVVDHVLDRLRSVPAGARGGWIVTPNVDILRKLVRDQDARAAVSGATLGVADGMPLVWASRLQGTPLPARVAGSSLLESLTAAAATADVPVYLVGGAEGVAEAAAANLVRRYDGLRATGWSPPFGVQDTADGLAHIAAGIAGRAAGIVFCGFGFPKQERVIGALRAQFPDVWFVGCGAGITFAAGRIDRAPEWMQRIGVEWLHRLLSEPRRMFRRYVVEGIPFALGLLVRSLLARRSAKHPGAEPLVDLAGALDDPARGRR